MEVKLIKTCHGWQEMVLVQGVPVPRNLYSEILPYVLTTKAEEVSATSVTPSLERR